MGPSFVVGRDTSKRLKSFSSRESKTFKKILDYHMIGKTGGTRKRYLNAAVQDAWALHLSTMILLRESLGYLIPTLNSKLDWLLTFRKNIRFAH